MEKSFSFDEWIVWSFEKYSEGNKILNRRQMKLAVISLIGKKPKLNQSQKLFTLDDLRRTIGDISFRSFADNANKIYDEIDKEQKGYVKLQDLYSAAQQYCPGISETLITQAFTRADTDNDGMISYKDFMSIVHLGFQSIGV